MTASYQIRQCNEYGKLGMLGVTILYSSGDNGVGGPGVCINPKTGSDFIALLFNGLCLTQTQAKKQQAGHGLTQVCVL